MGERIGAIFIGDVIGHANRFAVAKDGEQNPFIERPQRARLHFLATLFQQNINDMARIINIFWHAWIDRSDLRVQVRRCVRALSG